ncbi:hypothetical protein BDN71DRAFT_682814 [Pleurotus eryngii]|uniref:Uncharacterized protein n=1 Tax=Pleurotus eryngii TaxID=5323 RepID=A0A9P6D8B1_PLEER|nr:hypothetical protein BDN71DRAFT_682814 [Pleurotus eryngii]
MLNNLLLLTSHCLIDSIIQFIIAILKIVQSFFSYLIAFRVVAIDIKNCHKTGASWLVFSTSSPTCSATSFVHQRITNLFALLKNTLDKL